jgi:N-methylhydantoinase A
MRYEGQSFDLGVAIPDGPVTATTIEALAEGFGREHEKTYGHRAGREEPVEVVSLQVVGRGIPERPRMPDRLEAAGSTPSVTSRPAYFGAGKGWIDTPVLARAALATPRHGPCIHGPCIIEEYDATCLVPPGATASLDASGNIVIELQD